MIACGCFDCDGDCDQYAEPGDELCYDCEQGVHRQDREKEGAA